MPSSRMKHFSQTTGCLYLHKTVYLKMVKMINFMLCVCVFNHNEKMKKQECFCILYLYFTIKFEDLHD